MLGGGILEEIVTYPIVVESLVSKRCLLVVRQVQKLPYKVDINKFYEVVEVNLSLQVGPPEAFVVARSIVSMGELLSHLFLKSHEEFVNGQKDELADLDGAGR